MTLLGGGVIPLSPVRSLCVWRGFNLAAIIRGIIGVVCARSVTDGLRQHVRRWAHEEQSAGNDPDRGGIRQRLLSSRCCPKRRRRNEEAEFHWRPGETKFDWWPGEASFLCEPGEAKSAEASSRRQRGEATLTRRPGHQARVGRCLPVALEGKRYAVIEPAKTRNGREPPYQLHPNAAGEDGLGEFGGRPSQGSAGTEQHELDGAEIRQTVTIRDFGKARRDQLARENRDA